MKGSELAGDVRVGTFPSGNWLSDLLPLLLTAGSQTCCKSLCFPLGTGDQHSLYIVFWAPDKKCIQIRLDSGSSARMACVAPAIDMHPMPSNEELAFTK